MLCKKGLNGLKWAQIVSQWRISNSKKNRAKFIASINFFSNTENFVI
jgi:hypothetical protein